MYRNGSGYRVRPGNVTDHVPQRTRTPGPTELCAARNTPSSPTWPTSAQPRGSPAQAFEYSTDPWDTFCFGTAAGWWYGPEQSCGDEEVIGGEPDCLFELCQKAWPASR